MGIESRRMGKGRGTQKPETESLLAGEIGIFYAAISYVRNRKLAEHLAEAVISSNSRIAELTSTDDEKFTGQKTDHGCKVFTLVKNRVIFSCVIAEDFSYAKVTKFLNQTADNFQKVCSGDVQSLSAEETREITFSLREGAEHWSNPNVKMSKAEEELSGKIDNLRAVAMDTLEIQMLRHGKIQEVDMNSGKLLDSSERFRNTSKDIKKMYCVKNWKLTICIIVIALVLLLVLLMVLCDPDFNKCSSSK